MRSVLKVIGKTFEAVVGTISTADKVTRTVSSLLKHIKAFNDERCKIWEIPVSEIEVESEKVQ